MLFMLCKEFVISILKVYFLIGFFLFMNCKLTGQNQALADSLVEIYTSNRYEVDNQLVILNELAIHSSDVEKKLAFSKELIVMAKIKDSIHYIPSGFIEQGHALWLKSDYENALKSFFNAARATKKKKILGAAYVAIADVYAEIGNNDNAVTYYNNAVEILRYESDSSNLASALLNAGDTYFNYGQLDSALMYTKESSLIFNKINYPLGRAYALGNMGMIYAELGKDKEAEEKMNLAIRIMNDLGDYYPIAVYLTYISDIYSTKGNIRKALTYTHQSLELATTNQLNKQISDANLQLSKLYEKNQDHKNSFKYYKDHIFFRDSVQNIKVVQNMADLRTKFEVSQKQLEVDQVNKEKNIQRIIGLGLLAVLGVGAVLLFSLFRANRVIFKEKKRSDKLLLNILPKETAEELKKNGTVKARRYNAVSVLFTDFEGFTSYAESLSPEELVSQIDYFFTRFDAIIDKHGLEKIKTIGDGYMCACGLPFPSEDHATKMVNAAIEIVEFVEQEKTKGLHRSLNIRVGINSGPVVAGVVGSKKFAYDIWGDTVNTASRMETNSESGKINISESTFHLVKDTFNCIDRGKLAVKNKGLMNMYFVEGVK